MCENKHFLADPKDAQLERKEVFYRSARIVPIIVPFSPNIGWDNFFSSSLSRVIMIKKGATGPSAGSVMFIGGRIGENESPSKASLREFYEEANITSCVSPEELGKRQYSFFYSKNGLEEERSVDEHYFAAYPPAIMPLNLHYEANIKEFVFLNEDGFRELIDQGSYGEGELLDSLKEDYPDADTQKTAGILSSVEKALRKSDLDFRLYILKKFIQSAIFEGYDLDPEFTGALDEIIWNSEVGIEAKEELLSALQNTLGKIISPEDRDRIFEIAHLAGFLEYNLRLAEESGQKELIFAKILENNNIPLGKIIELARYRDEQGRFLFEVGSAILERVLDLMHIYATADPASVDIYSKLGKAWKEIVRTGFTQKVNKIVRFLNFIRRQWDKNLQETAAVFPDIDRSFERMSIQEFMRKIEEGGDKGLCALRLLILALVESRIEEVMPVQPPRFISVFEKSLSKFQKGNKRSEIDDTEVSKEQRVWFLGGVKTGFSVLRKAIGKGFIGEVDRIKDFFRYTVVPRDEDPVNFFENFLRDFMESFLKEQDSTAGPNLSKISISNVRMHPDYSEGWRSAIENITEMLERNGLEVNIQDYNPNISSASSGNFRWLKVVLNFSYKNETNETNETEESIEIQIFANQAEFNNKLQDDSRYVIARMLFPPQKRLPSLRLLLNDGDYSRLCQFSRYFSNIRD